MINSLIELKEPLLRAMEDATGSKTLTLRITDVEWDMLEKLQDTLKPVLDVTRTPRRRQVRNVVRAHPCLETTQECHDDERL
ncbi:hypothetical protein HPB48_007149 [Haemaphysalis longicornis]|uniref:Uncharacterized protein n=1 Tax=Haemaphysalis longicornis TaxID=44386 RepID=A0A9J6GJM3_HAELO|nr:hypothetical protein HPB48_007149 [Haemaphysalis longicornis]